MRSCLDQVDGDLTDQIVTTGDCCPLQTFEPGQQVVVYTVQDMAGNIATELRVVEVVPDIVPPVIDLIGGSEVSNANYIIRSVSCCPHTDNRSLLT